MSLCLEQGVNALFFIEAVSLFYHVVEWVAMLYVVTVILRSNLTLVALCR